MRGPLAVLALVTLVTAAVAAPSPAPDPSIAAAVARVSAERLKADDTRLVAFGTRSTFSEQMGGGRGVSAARALRMTAASGIRATHGKMSVVPAEDDGDDDGDDGGDSGE